MRLTFVTLLAATVLAAAPAMSAPAGADVKTGVDAWNQGDDARAIEMWRPLAIAGNADAQFNLGQAYKLGRGVPVDLPIAAEWFRKAAEQGHEKAVDNYGLLLFQQGRREDSMPYIKAASERGDPRAQYVYGTALFNGDLAPRDWVRAYALMTRAAQAGVTQATTSLQQMDQYIPEAQRTAGLQLASAMNRGAAPATTASPVLAQVAPPTVAPAKAASVPVAPAPVIVAAAPPPTVIAAQDGPAARPPVRKRGPQQTLPPEAKAEPKPEPKAKPETRIAQAAPAPASPAPAPAPAASGRWRVQLGAFREANRAPALWKSLSGKVSGLSAFQPSFVPANGLTRLLVGPLASQADAQRLCARIKPTGTPCVAQGM